MAEFDARANLYSVVRSILAGDRQSQELLDAADDAIERQAALCTCGLPRRAIMPEEHDETCPVVSSVSEQPSEPET